jgi:hypothetical protein
MRIDTFDSDSPVRYDKQLFNELCSLHFLDDARGGRLGARNRRPRLRS